MADEFVQNLNKNSGRICTPDALIIESMFSIANKDKQDVPFILNPSQRRYDANRTRFDIISKARQQGFSSLILAYFAVKCLSVRNTRAVVISHDNESTERLFARVKYYLENIRGPKPDIGTSAKRELSFPKTNSVFYIGTAGGRRFGRGDTITDLHCSEVAFWENPTDLTAGLFQAVPKTSGTIILESTGNGKNWFYRKVQRALENKGRYKLHFFDWISFPEYDLPVTPEEEEEIFSSLDSELEEDYLVNEVGLTAGQIKFRRDCLDDMDYDLDLFKQEYPLTVDECFRATGKSVFHKVFYVQTPDWMRVDNEFSKLKGHPRPDRFYGIGADVGGGVGGDNSVAQIIDLEKTEQVGEWASNRFAPDVFGKTLAVLGKKFNMANIAVEANNHGILTLAQLRRSYPDGLIYKKEKKPNVENPKEVPITDYGLLHSARNRPFSIGMLRKMLATVLKVHSPQLVMELDTFIETDAGKLEAEEGCYDDRVMAMAVFALTFSDAVLNKIYQVNADDYDLITTNPFLLDNIIDELSGRGRGLPISAGVRMLR